MELLKIISKGAILIACIPLTVVLVNMMMPIFLMTGVATAQIFTPYTLNTNNCGGTPSPVGNCFNLNVNTNLVITSILISATLMGISIIAETALKSKR
jgi:hypothetical protein